MPIIDTHCHYNMEPLYSGEPVIFKFKENDPLLKMNWQDHWQQAQNKGIVGSVVVGTMIETTNKALEIAASDPNLIAAVGIHPNHAHEVTLDQLNDASERWKDKTFHAVGETGLDFYRLDRDDHFEKVVDQQKQVLRWHLKLAEKHDLPVILHVRDKTDQAHWETLEIMKKEYRGSKPFVLHCASGPKEYIQQAVKLGAYIGFDGNISYPKAEEIREMISSIPKDRLLIETDAPFLPPQDYRGKVCQPWMIAETAIFVERELKIDLDQILANSEKFFEHKFVK